MRPTRLPALSLLAALACAPPAEQPQAAAVVDTAAVEQAVGDLWHRMATADTTGDAAALAALHTETARLDVRGFSPIVGRAAIDSAGRSVYAQLDYTDMQISPDNTVVVSNELAYQSGSYTQIYTQGRRAMAEYGRYATAVVKEADGQWRVGYLISFTDSTVASR